MNKHQTCTELITNAKAAMLLWNKGGDKEHYMRAKCLIEQARKAAVLEEDISMVEIALHAWKEAYKGSVHSLIDSMEGPPPPPKPSPPPTPPHILLSKLFPRNKKAFITLEKEWDDYLHRMEYVKEHALFDDMQADRHAMQILEAYNQEFERRSMSDRVTEVIKSNGFPVMGITEDEVERNYNNATFHLRDVTLPWGDVKEMYSHAIAFYVVSLAYLRCPEDVLNMKYELKHHLMKLSKYKWTGLAKYMKP